MNREDAAYLVRTALIRKPHIRYAAVYQRAWKLVEEYQLDNLLDCAYGWVVQLWGPGPIRVAGDAPEAMDWALELGRQHIVLQLAEEANPYMVERLCLYNNLEGLRVALASFEPSWQIVRYAINGDQLKLMYSCQTVARQKTALYPHVSRDLIPTLAELVPPTPQLLRHARVTHPAVADAILEVAPWLGL